MLEIEQKFHYTDEIFARLVDGADFLGEKRIHDMYYDSESFELAKKDYWLRNRDSAWELKIPGGSQHAVFTQYLELEAPEEILARLGLSGDIDGAIKSVYRPFIDIETLRRTYKKDGITIDIDEVTGEDFLYRLGEIEIVVDGEDEAVAQERLMQFAGAHGIEARKMRGKVYRYISEKYPELAVYIG